MLYLGVQRVLRYHADLSSYNQHPERDLFRMLFI
jgi:hypothetical protein